MLPLADLSYLGQALPYPLALSCHTPLWLRFSCHSLPCSFVPLPCHAFDLPWSASILATALLTNCPGPVLFFPGFSSHLFFMSCMFFIHVLHVLHSCMFFTCPSCSSFSPFFMSPLASPFKRRADLPWHFTDLSWLCLPLGCLGLALILLTLLYPHC